MAKKTKKQKQLADARRSQSHTNPSLPSAPDSIPQQISYQFNVLHPSTHEQSQISHTIGTLSIQTGITKTLLLGVVFIGIELLIYIVVR